MSRINLRAVSRVSSFLLCTSLLAACGGGGGDDDPPAPAPQYSVAGSASGLAGSGLTLLNNGANSLAVTANGSFTFGSVTSGTSYAVTVGTQPTSPPQTCSIANGTGTVGSDIVTNIAVTCVTKLSIGGTVTGLSAAGVGLILSNKGENFPVSADGTFTFPTFVASGEAYDVTVSRQPASPTQACTVTNGSGTAGANVTNIVVNCALSKFDLGGTVSGLVGSGLKLKDATGGGELPVTANGTFKFAGSLLSGSEYDIKIVAQPTNPGQTCAIANAKGTVTNAEVTNVALTCATNTYSLGVSVSGLAGSGLKLQNNSGSAEAVTGNGAFTFASRVETGSTYNVTVATQPTNPSQTCVISSGTGNVLDSNITSVTAVCTTNSFKVGGTASGLTGTGLQLQINGGDDLAIGANGAFQFTTSITSGQTYAVTVLSQPSTPTQTCVLSKGNGTVGAVTVTDVKLTCTVTPARFAYASTTSGLYCFSIDAVSAGLVPLDQPKCANGYFRAVAVEPTGRFVYAADDPGLVTIGLSVDQTTGKLTTLSGVGGAGQPFPVDMEIDPSGQFLYVLNYSGSTISAFKLNPTTAVMTAVAGSPFATGQKPNGLKIDPTGQFLYTANSQSQNVSAFVIDSGTGALTPVAGSPFAASGLLQKIAIDPASKFAFVTSEDTGRVHAFTINGATGALTPVAGSPFNTGTGPSGTTVDTTGAYLYVANKNSNSISGFAIDPTLGTLAPVLGSPFLRLGGPNSLTVHPSGGFIYATNSGAATVATYSIDQATGALTEIGGSPVSSTAGAFNIVISP